MNVYPLVLFLHVGGDVGIFIGLGVQLLSLAGLRRATHTAQVHSLAWLIRISDVVSVSSALLLLGAGLYMALTVWSLRTGWIAVALASIIVLLGPLIAAFIEPRTRAIVMIAKGAPDGPLSESLQRRIHDPVLGTALQTAGAIILGIVFLMTNKPGLVDSLVVMVIALTLGLASGLPLWRSACTRSTG